MCFTFNFIEVADIPCMAWCLKFTSKSKIVEVVHGRWVDKGEDYFVEGAWAGTFHKGDIHLSCSLMGSGGKIVEGKLIICTPSNTVEAVYSIKTESYIFFSNSLTFLLELTKDDLDINYINYENDILSISDGLKKFKNKIPLKSGNKLNLHYFYNVVVNENLNLFEVPKPEPPDFYSFEEYKSHLSHIINIINSNATSALRKKRFKPLVFCSKGYDSAACAVLGKEIGCDEAVVYETKKMFRIDSGYDIVKYLGYSLIHKKNELDYLNYNNAEDFVATGELGTSIYFASAENILEGKILLSGIHGGILWDKYILPVEDIIRSFYPDTARKEFRLRVGFILLTVPFIGVVKHHQIHIISNSSEMKLWVLGNNYDRPIPRRIVEEKGIPRDMFGIQKGGGAGSSLRFGNLAYLKKVMPSESFDHFYKFYTKEKRKRKTPLLFFFKRTILYGIYISSIYLRRESIIDLDKIFRVSKWNRKYKCSPWAPSFLFHWGVSKVRQRYSNAAKILYGKIEEKHYEDVERATTTLERS